MAKKSTSSAAVASMAIPAEIAALVSSMTAQPVAPKSVDNFTVILNRVEFRNVTVDSTPAIVVRNVDKPRPDGSGMFELHSTPMFLADLDALIARALVARQQLAARIAKATELASRTEEFGS